MSEQKMCEECAHSGSYYIVNDLDRPHEDMIAELVCGGLWYLDREKRKKYPAMAIKEATPVSSFGVVLEETDGVLRGTLSLDSTATYRDGRRRIWQGSKTFSVAIQPKGES